MKLARDELKKLLELAMTGTRDNARYDIDESIEDERWIAHLKQQLEKECVPPIGGLICRCGHDGAAHVIVGSGSSYKCSLCACDRWNPVLPTE